MTDLEKALVKNFLNLVKSLRDQDSVVADPLQLQLYWTLVAHGEREEANKTMEPEAADEPIGFAPV